MIKVQKACIKKNVPLSLVLLFFLFSTLKGARNLREMCIGIGKSRESTRRENKRKSISLFSTFLHRDFFFFTFPRFLVPDVVFWKSTASPLPWASLFRVSLVKHPPHPDSPPFLDRLFTVLGVEWEGERGGEKFASTFCTPSQSRGLIFLAHEESIT